MKLAILAAFVLVSPVFAVAQELLPELQPIAGKYKTDSAALESQKTVAMSRAKQVYDSALDAAEKSATAAGQVPVVTAVTKERDALKSDQMSPTAPRELPRALVPQRKAYEDAFVRITADFEQRQQRADADYLRALSGLQARAGTNPELAKQLATEKASLLQRGPSVTPQDLSKSLQNSTWEGRGRTMMLRMTFNANGSALADWDHNIRGQWKVVSGNKFTVRFEQREIENWTIAPDLQAATNPEGVTWRRVK